MDEISDESMVGSQEKEKESENERGQTNGEINRIEKPIELIMNGIREEEFVKKYKEEMKNILRYDDKTLHKDLSTVKVEILQELRSSLGKQYLEIKQIINTKLTSRKLKEYTVNDIILISRSIYNDEDIKEKEFDKIFKSDRAMSMNDVCNQLSQLTSQISLLRSEVEGLKSENKELKSENKYVKEENKRISKQNSDLSTMLDMEQAWFINS